jgi:ATP-binding cassette, subfamily B, bacterial
VIYGLIRLLTVAGRTRMLLLQALVASVVLAASAPAYVASSQAFIQHLGHQDGQLWGLVALLGLLAGTDRTFRVLESNVEMLLAEEISTSAHADLLVAVSRVPYENFDTGRWRDQLSLAADTARFRLASFVRAILQLGRTVLANIGIVSTLASVDWVLAAAALVSAALLVPGSLFESRQSYRLFYGQSRKYRERYYLAQVLTSAGHAKDVRTLDLGPELQHRYLTEAHRWLGDLRRSIRLSNLVALGSAAASGAAIAIGYAAVALRTDRSGVAGVVAALTGFLLLSGQLGAAIVAYGQVAEQASFVRGFWNFMRDLEATESPTPHGPDPSIPGSVPAIPETPPVVSKSAPRADPTQEERQEHATASAIRLSSLSFAYRDGTKALRGIDLHVETGEWIAVVGRNGAGKSSLMKILAGLYRPDSGTVHVLGTEPRPGSTAIAVMWQDFQLFEVSIEDNVRFGRWTPAADPDIHERSRRQIVEKLVEAGLPHLTTDSALARRLGHLSDTAHDLSGGQRQRLGLARTAFRDAKIWLLDEPTASLDPEDAASLVQRLRTRFPTTTAVVITHHLGVAHTLDRVLVLRDGEAIENGSPHALLDLDGEYARMYHSQASAFRRDESDARPPGKD